ncbi:MAG: HPP family protein [SAR202 cluster bacterium Casp-Chloro-G3]|nr:MAG: HPP family protein [SAR202 cluster bacterium Casp-Chloro-G3]
MGYLAKMKGDSRRIIEDTPFIEKLKNSSWAWLGSSLAIGLCAYLSSRFFEPWDTALIIGSFGASAVLVYGVIDSPLSQPKNLVGGHMLSGVIGVACFLLLGTGWAAAALAVSFSIVAMILTNTVHPPGGATALIAIIGGGQVHQLGFWYVLAPAGLGAVVLLIVALLVNNLARDRRYPQYWF